MCIRDSPKGCCAGSAAPPPTPPSCSNPAHAEIRVGIRLHSCGRPRGDAVLLPLAPAVSTKMTVVFGRNVTWHFDELDVRLHGNIRLGRFPAWLGLGADLHLGPEHVVFPLASGIAPGHSSRSQRRSHGSYRDYGPIECTRARYVARRGVPVLIERQASGREPPNSSHT